MCRSLSPRPERFTRRTWSLRIVGASFVAYATAWLDSSAGMMPSIRQHSWKASSASSSVAADVRRPSAVLQPRVLGAHARIVQAGADRVRFGDLAVLVLQHVGPVAVQHARRPASAGSRRAARRAGPRPPPRRRSGAPRGRAECSDRRCPSRCCRRRRTRSPRPAAARSVRGICSLRFLADDRAESRAPSSGTGCGPATVPMM